MFRRPDELLEKKSPWSPPGKADNASCRLRLDLGNIGLRRADSNIPPFFGESAAASTLMDQPGDSSSLE